MICNKYFAIILFSYLIYESNASIVSFIKPCKANDKACLVSSSQAALPYIVAGIPALGVPTADPIFIEAVTTDDANQMKLDLKNITVTGVSECKILEIVRDTEKNILKFVAESPLHGIGQYSLNGTIRSIEAFGNGEFKISTNKAKITVEIKIDIIEKDRHKYWDITDFDYSYDLIDKVHLDFKNLYNGDEEKAKPLQQLLNTFSNQLVRELGDDLIKQLLSKFVDIVKAFFHAVPTEELEVTT